MHLHLNRSRIPSYVPILLIVAGFGLVLTGLVALQVVGVGLLLIAFAIPIVGTIPARGQRSYLPPILAPSQKSLWIPEDEEDEPVPPAMQREFDEEVERQRQREFNAKMTHQRRRWPSRPSSH